MFEFVATILISRTNTTVEITDPISAGFLLGDLCGADKFTHPLIHPTIGIQLKYNPYRAQVGSSAEGSVLWDGCLEGCVVSWVIGTGVSTER